VRGEFLDLDGARIYYYAAGTRGAGNPVVFVHGFPTSGHLWGDLVPLMPPGHRLVVLDLLGFGRSDRPMQRPIDMRAQAERVVAVLDELSIKEACVVGHGVGGGIAQSMAVRHPSRVSHLCLVDSVAFSHWPSVLARLGRALAPAAALLPPSSLLTLLRRELARSYRDPIRAARSIDIFLRPFKGSEGRDALLSHVRALRADETEALAPKLAAIRAPTALLWGRHDRVTSVGIGKRLQASIPAATLTIIDDGGHFTPEEAPRQVADGIAALLRR
jgi:pimeloyl-ACP methyl ester carboxylesterase